MSINDHQIYIDFCKLDFRFKGAKASDPKKCRSELERTLLDGKNTLSEAKNTLISNNETVLKPAPIHKKSSEIVAERLGVCSKTVENCRFISDYAAEDTKKRLSRGEITIREAMRLTREFYEYNKRLKTGVGRPRTKPKSTMFMNFLNTYEHYRKFHGQDLNTKVNEILRILCNNLLKDGWISKMEAEEIRQMLERMTTS